MSDPGQNKTPEKYKLGTEVSYNIKKDMYVKATITKPLENTAGNKNNKVHIGYIQDFGLNEEPESTSNDVDLDEITIPFETGTVVYFDKPLHCNICGLKLCSSNCELTAKGIIKDVMEVSVVDSWKYHVQYNDNVIGKTQNELRTTEKSRLNRSDFFNTNEQQ